MNLHKAFRGDLSESDLYHGLKDALAKDGFILDKDLTIVPAERENQQSSPKLGKTKSLMGQSSPEEPQDTKPVLSVAERRKAAVKRTAADSTGVKADRRSVADARHVTQRAMRS